MKQFAADNGFELLGKVLPDGFLLRGTSLNDPELSDVMRGTIQGVDTVVFTALFATGTGKRVTVRMQTVVAFPNVRKLGRRQIPPTGDPNLYLESAGEWLTIYYRAATVEQDRLRVWCERMYAITQKVTGEPAAV